MSEEAILAGPSHPEAPLPQRPMESPEALTLRAAPRRAVRFRRGVIIGGAATGSIAIAAVAWMALGQRPLQTATNSDQAQIDRRLPADAVANLPGDYAKVPRGVPVLGPPLPGDLGRPILDRQRELLARSDPAVLSQPVVESPAKQAADAERQRLAAQSNQAREAGVMVQSSGRTTAVAGASVGPETAANVPAPSVERGKLALDPERDQNNQQRKLDFAAGPAGSTVNAHAVEPAGSPNMVMAGSAIAASLLTGLNSDLPGMVVAQVTENIFDTVTGRILLIPQGSRLIGSYDSVVAFGQSRALLVWQRIVLPDGSSVQIDNLPATDAAGYAGLEDRVDFHSWRLLKGVALSTLLGVGTELSIGGDSDLVRAIRQSTQQSASQAGQQIVTKQLGVQPTIRVRPGWPLRIIVYKDLVLRPWAAR